MDHLMTYLIVFVEVSLYVVVFRIREDIEKGKKAESWYQASDLIHQYITTELDNHQLEGCRISTLSTEELQSLNEGLHFLTVRCG